MEDKKDGNVKEDSEVISRRSFMRKSAEVAALSLFGMMGLDAVTGRVLERIAESKAMGRLADSAAKGLKRHRAHYSASAGMYDWACGPFVINSCDIHGHICHQTYYCDGTDQVYCNKFKPGCSPSGEPYGQYGCTVRDLDCVNEHACDLNNCTLRDQGGRFACGIYNRI